MVYGSVQGMQSLIQRLDVDPSYGVADAYEHLAPVIDTDNCMAWLTAAIVQSKGAKLIAQTIRGNLFAQEDNLRVRFHADAIVNAAGLGSFEIAGDLDLNYQRRDSLSKDCYCTAMPIAAGATRDSEIVGPKERQHLYPWTLVGSPSVANGN